MREDRRVSPSASGAKTLSISAPGVLSKSRRRASARRWRHCIFSAAFHSSPVHRHALAFLIELFHDVIASFSKLTTGPVLLVLVDVDKPDAARSAAAVDRSVGFLETVAQCGGSSSPSDLASSSMPGEHAPTTRLAPSIWPRWGSPSPRRPPSSTSSTAKARAGRSPSDGSASSAWPGGRGDHRLFGLNGFEVRRPCTTPPP